MKSTKYYLILLLQFVLHLSYGQRVMIDLEITAFEDFDKTMTKAVSRDFKLLATYHRDVIRIWDIESEKLIKEINYEKPLSDPVLCFSADSRSVIAVSNQKVNSWNLIDQSNLVSDLLELESYSIINANAVSDKFLVVEGLWASSYESDKRVVLILNIEDLTINKIFNGGDAIVSTDQKNLFVNNPEIHNIVSINLDNLSESTKVSYKGNLAPRFISSDSKIIAGSGDRGLTFHDIVKGRTIFTIKDFNYWKFVYEVNGIFVLYNYGGKVQIIDPLKRTTKTIAFDDSSLPFRFTLTNNTLSISSFSGNDQIIDINSGQQKTNFPSNTKSKTIEKAHFQAVQISRDGNKFFLVEKEGLIKNSSKIHVFDVARNAFEKVVELPGGFNTFIPNSDEVLCYGNGDNYIYNLANYSFKRIPKELLGRGGNPNYPNENLVIFSGYDEEGVAVDLVNIKKVDFPWLTNWNNYDSVIAVSISPDNVWSLIIKRSGKGFATDIYFGNKKISSHKTIYTNIKYSSDGASILLIDRSMAGATIISSSGDQGYTKHRALSGYFEGHWILENKNYNLEKFIQIRSDSSVKRNGYKVLINTDNTLSINDEKGNESLKVTILSDGQFLIQHESGLFDASEAVMSQLYFVQGVDIVEFSQLKERYYEPGLLRKVMAGEKLRNVVGMKSIELPPDIRVGQVDEKGYLPIDLTNKGGGIGEVAIFINGKEVIADARPKEANSEASDLSFKVFVGNHKSLIKGSENFIAVKAWNAGHWVVSRGTIITYRPNGNETAYKPAIHIIACGVSDYTGTELDLKYAAKDAEDVSKALTLGAKNLFGTDRSYIYNLTTNNTADKFPSKSNILKTFEKVSSTAHPLDVVVVYLSGHGINHGGQNGDWYYLTQDAYTASSTAYNDPEIRRNTTLSSVELVKLFINIHAKKQVLMIDACASGKVVESLMAKKDIESSTLRALDRMRDRTGLHIITGCTADAVSYEASKYGQGVLTYSLLEGIRGAALREDQFVDINKLFQYAHDRVPLLAEGIGGIQTPQIFSPQGTQSFDIGQLDDVSKKAIPIAKIRPVYIRSTFLDDDQLEDALQLGKKIDDALNEAASKGTNSNIIFVDVREYPEGCKLSGRYKQEKGIIKLKLRKKCEGNDETIDIEGKTVEEIKNIILSQL
ncbi:MAG: caspase family protein [Cyclobacteriaceae bacterium]|nr:caspase family protein [Cyclobacteriaceae bacterium]